MKSDGGASSQKATQSRSRLQPHLNQHSQHSKAIRLVQCHGYAGVLVWVEVYYVHLEDETVQRYSVDERTAQGKMSMIICTIVWSFP